jgi:hypothetical protein
LGIAGESDGGAAVVEKRINPPNHVMWPVLVVKSLDQSAGKDGVEGPFDVQTECGQ